MTTISGDGIAVDNDDDGGNGKISGCDCDGGAVYIIIYRRNILPIYGKKFLL